MLRVGPQRTTPLTGVPHVNVTRDRRRVSPCHAATQSNNAESARLWPETRTNS